MLLICIFFSFLAPFLSLLFFFFLSFLQLCLIGALLCWKQPWPVLYPLLSVQRLREAGLKPAAGVVFPVCFRTADSCQGPAVSATSCLLACSILITF